MGVLKDSAEDLNFACGKIRAVVAWASTSSMKRLIILFLVSVVLIAFTGIYFYYLLEQVTNNSNTHAREVGFLQEELKYKVTLDSIDLCIESSKYADPLRASYCQDAVLKYKQASINWPQPERVKELCDKGAYGAMRNDVSHYIRYIELERLTFPPATKRFQLLDAMLSKTGVGLWLVLVFSILTFVAFVLWREALRRERSAKAEGQGKA